MKGLKALRPLYGAMYKRFKLHVSQENLKCYKQMSQVKRWFGRDRYSYVRTNASETKVETGRMEE